MQREIYSIKHTDKSASFNLSKKLDNFVNNVNKSFDRISLVCIGTDRSTGDCYGPLVGHILSKVKIYNYDLHGTLDNPVHAKNLNEVLDSIDVKKNLIIAIDSSLGNLESIGYISMGYGGIKPGSGVGKDLPEIGDIHISGIVNVGGFIPHLVLQSTRLSTVYKMAEITSSAIKLALYKRYKQNKLARIDVF